MTSSDAEILGWTIGLLDDIAAWEHTPSGWAELGGLIRGIGEAAARGDVAAVQDAAAELDDHSPSRGPDRLRPAAGVQQGGPGGPDDDPVLEVWTPMPSRIGADLDRARASVRRLAETAGAGGTAGPGWAAGPGSGT